MGLDANFDEALLNQEWRRCQACGGGGWKDRRHKAAGKVLCRVCQGFGSICVSLVDGRITPITYSKIYWHRRWPPRTSRWG
jgi:hypothetical protein